MILRKEWMKRKSTNILYPSKGLQCYPLACIVCGSLSAFFGAIRFLPIACYFSGQIYSVMIGWQALFLGYFQLSRLHYCFATTQVYSNKGYPNWVFTIMYIIGIINVLLTSMNSFIYSGNSPSRCYINYKFQYTQSEPDLLIDDNQYLFILLNIGDITDVASSTHTLRNCCLVTR